MDGVETCDRCGHDVDYHDQRAGATGNCQYDCEACDDEDDARPLFEEDFDREVLLLASQRNPDIAFFPGEDY